MQEYVVMLNFEALRSAVFLLATITLRGGSARAKFLSDIGLN